MKIAGGMKFWIYEVEGFYCVVKQKIPIIYVATTLALIYAFVFTHTDVRFSLDMV